MLTSLLLLALAADGLTAKAPPTWTSVATTSSMRVVQFTLPLASGDTGPAELIVYYFGGGGGSVEANIERWIGQMQQPDGRASKDVATREVRTVNGLTVTLVDVSGTYVAETMPGAGERHNRPGFRLRAAVVPTPKGPYFVKLTGPAKTIAAETAAFDAFIASLRYER